MASIIQNRKDGTDLDFSNQDPMYSKKCYEYTYSKKLLDLRLWDLKITRYIEETYYDIDQGVSIKQNRWTGERCVFGQDPITFQRSYNESNEIVEIKVPKSILSNSRLLFSCLIVRREYKLNDTKVSLQCSEELPPETILYEDFIEYQDGDQHYVQSISCDSSNALDDFVMQIKSDRVCYQTRVLPLEGIFRYDSKLYCSLKNIPMLSNPFQLPDKKYESLDDVDFDEFPLHKKSKHHKYISLNEERSILIRKKGLMHLFEGDQLSITQKMIHDACVE
eukprot:NODE_539_length_6273_cov_0.700194.p4 type:complete len:278 gc:universal NODE_539_length_6273_cov_0.700194:1031-198(-)